MNYNPEEWEGRYNRLQRKQINRVFAEAFRKMQCDTEVKAEAVAGDELATKMVAAFDHIKAISNPSFEEKIKFLKAVAPNWEGLN